MDAARSTNRVLNLQNALRTLSILGLTTHFWPKQANITDGDSYDYIVIGAGSAGCVIANRLSELNVSVLLVEAGGDPLIDSVKPGLLVFLKNSVSDWNFTSERDVDTYKFHKNNVLDITRGKVLGGSSSINFMVYTRGNRRDYDSWVNITGDYSWSWNHLLPYFKKSEQMLDPDILNTYKRRYHGTNGYMKITRPYRPEIDKYLKAFEELGYNIDIDLNGGDNLGYAELNRNVADGIRQSTAISFLSTIKNRKNLHILRNTLVSKILFNSNKAIGVEVILESGQKMIIKAREEVIVSAGAINSPQILMISGIGPKNHLRDMGIKVIKDLPVGQELKDHTGTIIIQKMNGIKANDGPFTLNMDDTPDTMFQGFGSPNLNQRNSDYQAINFIIDNPQGVLQFSGFFFGLIDELCQEYFEAIRGKQYLYTLLSMMYPKSSGRILLKSKNPKDAPLIYMGTYSEKSDLISHAEYLKHFLKVNGTKFFRSMNSELVVPKLCGCGNFVDTSEFYECFVACNLVQVLHHTGTCAIGKVVDSQLKIIGLRNIRVVDASVVPSSLSSNTNAPIMMIAEKASDMIKEDYFARKCAAKHNR